VTSIATPAGCKAGPDLKAQKAAPEQRVAETVSADQLRHSVDNRLREPFRTRHAVNLPRAVAAELRA